VSSSNYQGERGKRIGVEKIMKKIAKKKIVYSLDQVPMIATKLKKLLKQHPVMTFSGSLGAGKTTLIQELLRQLGVKDVVTSPTFTYMNRYQNDQGVNFYHFDLYRAGGLDDFLAVGFEEFLYVPDSYTFIEWPEHIMPLLKNNVCHIQIEYAYDPSQREIIIECVK
jgi:tRNA threonylcarbamoyladenosine biosynthesis protein TsaE